MKINMNLVIELKMILITLWGLEIFEILLSGKFRLPPFTMED